LGGPFAGFIVPINFGVLRGPMRLLGGPGPLWPPPVIRALRGKDIIQKFKSVEDSFKKTIMLVKKIETPSFMRHVINNFINTCIL